MHDFSPLHIFYSLFFSQLCIKHEVNHVSFTLDSLSHSAFILRSVAAYKCFQRSVSSKDHTGPICYHTLLRKRFSSAHRLLHLECVLVFCKNSYQETMLYFGTEVLEVFSMMEKLHHPSVMKFLHC